MLSRFLSSLSTKKRKINTHVSSEKKNKNAALNKYKKHYTPDEINLNKNTDAPPKISSAIYSAARNGDEKKLKKLVEMWFANPVLNDYSGGGNEWTPLMIASYKGWVNCVKILVSQPGIDINKGHKDLDETPLLWASKKGHVNVVKLLSSLPGINIKKPDVNGDTPYSAACEEYKGDGKEKRMMHIQEILSEKSTSRGGNKTRILKNDKRTKKQNTRRNRQYPP
jgi:hypothetical protein